MQNQIQEFNQKLVEENQDITVIDYVKAVNENYFNIDIDNFIDDFIDMIDKEGFNISHEMLFKYEILTKLDSYNVLRILENYNFEDGIDYALTVEDIYDGSVEKKVYFFNSNIFKIICMRSTKTRKFARYYLLLEKCVKYYNVYQLLKIQNKINDICKKRNT